MTVNLSGCVRPAGILFTKTSPIGHVIDFFMNPSSMTYRDTLAHLSSLNKMGIRFGLDPIRSLLERLHYPQNGYPTILIAGTNGKGSVAAMTAAILSAGGYKVGLYTSPDLTDFRERIRINDRMISREEAADCVEQLKEKVTEDVSYFEFLTAMAFLHFHRQHVDIAILEIGMGGRLDATNVVIPLLSVITNISLEHREYLGNTLEKITREKGGIIKEGGTCLTAAVQKAGHRDPEDPLSGKRGDAPPAGEGVPHQDLPGWNVFIPWHRTPV